MTVKFTPSAPLNPILLLFNRGETSLSFLFNWCAFYRGVLCLLISVSLRNLPRLPRSSDRWYWGSSRRWYRGYQCPPFRPRGSVSNISFRLSQMGINIRFKICSGEGSYFFWLCFIKSLKQLYCTFHILFHSSTFSSLSADIAVQP